MQKSRFEALLFFFSILVLLLCGYYVTLRIKLPLSVPWSSADWRVQHDENSCGREICLQKGDQVLVVGGVTREAFDSSRSVLLFDGDPPWEVVFRRGDEVLRTSIGFESMPALVRISLLTGPILLPLLFWIAGTLTAALGSRIDDRRRIMIAFFFNAAVFFSAGYIAHTHHGYSHYLVRITGAFFLPLAVHLHLLLPTAVSPKTRSRVLPPLYLLATVVAAADLAVGLPAFATYSLTAAGMLASLALLAGRILLPGQSPVAQRGLKLMLAGSLLGLLPWLLTMIVIVLDLYRLNVENRSIVLSIAVALSLPNWPLALLYGVLKPSIGSFELRPNRAMGSYGFWSLYVLAYLLTCMSVFDFWPALAGHPLEATLLLSLPFVMLGPIAQPAFQRWLDRRLGILFDPHQVVSAFAAKIPIAFERATLRRLIEEEILPALLVRQALLVLSGPEENKPEIFSELGLNEVPRPGAEELESLLQGPGGLRCEADGCDWIRLVLPLESQNERLGVWLLGRRDPDDDYPPEDRKELAALANQIAAVVRLQRELDEKTRLQSQLLQSQKMEAVGRLSAGVAHDFNNFLAAILGYSELLEGLDAKDPGFPRYLGGIREAAEKASALTMQLLSFSRRQATAEQVVELSELVVKMENLLRRVLASGVELVIQPSREPLLVRIDPGQFEQALLNLVVNANDAMPEGGRLQIATQHENIENLPPVSAMPPGRWAKVAVTDNGTGIAPEVLEHVFEPFFTTKKLGEGTGLGLAMVYAIVQRAGGHVVIDSELGRGSTFTLYFPWLTEAEKLSLTEAGPETRDDNNDGDWETKPGRGFTLLLVEDEPNVRQATADLLRVHGFAVLESADGFAALELCDAFDGKIDLLLTDVMMPHLRGPDLADRLLMRRPDLKVLFISGYNEELLLGERLEQSGARLLRKPCATRQLLKEIRSSLGR